MTKCKSEVKTLPSQMGQVKYGTIQVLVQNVSMNYMCKHMLGQIC